MKEFFGLKTKTFSSLIIDGSKDRILNLNITKTI